MRWQTIAPIRPEYRDARNHVAEPFDLGGVSIGPYSRCPLDPSLLGTLSYTQRRWISEDANLAFLVEYEADSLGEPDPSWAGAGPRGKQDIAKERIQLANIALWLALPTPLGFEVVAHQREEPEGFLGIQHEAFWWVRPLDQYARNSLTRTHLNQARTLFGSLLVLSRKGAVWVAVRTLFKGLVEREGIIRFPLLWIGIEALFGPADMRRVKRTISERAGQFLGAESSSNAEIRDAVAENYKFRSAVVHGFRVDGLEETAQEELLYAESILQKSLVKILNTAGLAITFGDEAQREAFFTPGP